MQIPLNSSDAIVKFIGSIAFLLLQVLLVLSWSAINLNAIPRVKAFDPFPFGVLALVISSESVLLTVFVLIIQNRMTRQAEKRSHLDLQVGMLAEQELTTMLQMQQKICQRLGIDVASEKHDLKGFSDATDVSKLASELEDKLPDYEELMMSENSVMHRVRHTSLISMSEWRFSEEHAMAAYTWHADGCRISWWTV